MKLNKQILDLEKRMSYDGLEFDYLKDKYKIEVSLLSAG